MSDEISPTRMCRNCGSPDVQQWCPVCGQEDVPSALPVREILFGFLEEFLKFDTKIWTTLKLLATKPGFLTNEYLEGRRVRYVAPIKLYLALSFVAFLVFALFPEGGKKSDSGGDLNGFGSGYGMAASLLPARPSAPDEAPEDADEESGSSKVIIVQKSSSKAPAPTPNPDRSAAEKHADACSDVTKPIQEQAAKDIEKAKEEQQATQSEAQRSRDKVRRDAWLSANRTTLNLLRIPLFALVLAFLLRKNVKRLYVEHLVFALHYQCFDQLRDLMATLVRPIPLLGGFLGFGLTIFGLAYFVQAAKAVYDLPLKRLVPLALAFLALAGLAVWATGFTAGIVYRLTG